MGDKSEEVLIMKCGKCGSENIPDGSVFCNVCGASLEELTVKKRIKPQVRIAIAAVLVLIVVGVGYFIRYR
jgi:hypothetical protein